LDEGKAFFEPVKAYLSTAIAMVMLMPKQRRMLLIG
jgi:hypothetical protein